MRSFTMLPTEYLQESRGESIRRHQEAQANKKEAEEKAAPIIAKMPAPLQTACRAALQSTDRFINFGSQNINPKVFAEHIMPFLEIISIFPDTILYLHNNEIGSEDTQALATLLTTKTTFKHLDISENSIGDDGAKYLAETLKQNKTLTTLSLRDNGIGDVGIGYLAEALKENSTVIHLSLQHNVFGDLGMQQLADSIQTNKTLRILNLSQNDRVTIPGAAPMLNVLAQRSLDKQLSHIAYTCPFAGSEQLDRVLACERYCSQSYDDAFLQDRAIQLLAIQVIREGVAVAAKRKATEEPSLSQASPVLHSQDALATSPSKAKATAIDKPPVSGSNEFSPAPSHTQCPEKQCPL